MKIPEQDMLVIRDKQEMREWSRRERADGKRIALVPTMGSLHKGHLSLIALSKTNHDITVVSIYINPTQFAAHEDYDVYPRCAAEDLESLQRAGANVAFIPETLYGTTGSMVIGTDEFSVARYDTFVVPDRLQQGLCGVSRPHFFRGVATVVAKLFNLVEPDAAVFGKKDYQQLCIIKNMVRDLDFAVEIIAGNIVREPDGLALSSRNGRLNPQSRSQANCIFEGLKHANIAWKSGQRAVNEIKHIVANFITPHASSIDYIEVVEAGTLVKLRDSVEDRAIVLVAAYFSSNDEIPVRLIDNMELGSEH